MAANFLVESSQDQAALELCELDQNFFLATLRSRGVYGTARVGTYMSGGFADLFESLANDWKGWEGIKVWGSLEGELRIEAHADRLGHLYLSIELREGAPAKWTLHADLVVDAGGLPRLASQARVFERTVLETA